MVDDDGVVTFPEPEGTRGEIMAATYEALGRHGYAALTVQDIADEFPKSKSLLYHHYDGKDDLLVDFLSYMLEQYEAQAESDRFPDARAELDAVLDRLFEPSFSESMVERTRLMAELRAQAASNDAYREQVTRTDEQFHERFADIVSRGIQDGSFRDVDPDAVAAMLLTLVNGAMERRATTDAEFAGSVRAEVDAYLAARLYREEA
jgi:AcrR family transcriptional regulator